MLTIAVRSVFEEGGKSYLQIFLDDCLHQMHQKSVIFVAFGILKILVIGMDRIFAILSWFNAKSYEF